MIESMDKAQRMVAFWRTDPVTAAKDIFNVDLEPHQRIALNMMWFNDVQTNILSRGTGKTFLNGLSASLEGILKPGHRVGLLAPSYRQSKLVWDEVDKLYRKSPLMQQATLKEPAITPEKCYMKFLSAEGKNSTVIEAVPMGSDGSKIRGLRYFSTYIDEAAQVEKEILDVVIRGMGATSANPVERANFIDEQKRLVAEGIITADQMVKPPANKEVFSTTAFYQYNHAYARVCEVIGTLQREYRFAQKENKDLSRFRFAGKALNGGQIPFRVMTNGREGIAAFTFMDIREGFMDMDTIVRARRQMSEYQFLMEFACFFPPDSEGFFRRSLLDAARSHAQFGPVLAPREGCLYTMGVDPARDDDNFAIAVYEIDPDALEIRLIRIFAYNKRTFPEMQKRIREIIHTYGIEYFEMDAGGGGGAIRDLLASTENCPAGERLILEQDNPQYRMVVGDRILGELIQFSNYNWVEGANFNLKAALEHGRLKIAAPLPIPGMPIFKNMAEVDQYDAADAEISEALSEWSAIITMPTGAGTRLHWDTPTKTMRKDRYSAILIGYSAAEKVLARLNKPKKLAVGRWG